MSDNPKDTLAAKHLREVWGKTVVREKLLYREDGDPTHYTGIVYLADNFTDTDFEPLKRVDKTATD